MTPVEKQAQNFDHIIADLPEDLDARFARLDTQFAHVREAQALHTVRFTSVEKKLSDKLDEMSAQLAELRQLIASR